MRKVLIFAFLLMVNAILVFAGLSDQIRVEVIDGNSVLITNYNDVPVTVSFTIEYTEGNFNRFEHKTISLGRNGFTNSTFFWGLRGIQISNVDIKSVR